jgi:hypothetical protein
MSSHPLSQRLMLLRRLKPLRSGTLIKLLMPQHILAQLLQGGTLRRVSDFEVGDRRCYSVVVLSNLSLVGSKLWLRADVLRAPSGQGPEQDREQARSSSHFPVSHRACPHALKIRGRCLFSAKTQALMLPK